MRPAIVFALIAVSSVAGAQSLTLRYKFKVGEVHTYTSSFSMDMKTSMPGGSYPNKTNMSMSMTQRVVKVDRDGSGTIQSSMNVHGGGQGAESMNGKKFSVKMSPLGKVSDISGDRNSGGTAGFDPSQIQMASAFPAGPVHIGSHWTNVTTIPKMGSITMHFTLTGLESSGGSQIATIKSTGMMDLGKVASAMGASAPGMHMTGSENMNITMKFNVTHGYMTETSMTGRTMTHVTMDDPRSGKKMAMSVSGNQKMTMHLVR